MARPGFYNDNLNRSYPFIHGQTGTLPDFAVADFGCVMGAESGFIEGQHSVRLHRVLKSEHGILEFEFRSDAPGLLDRVLRFTRNVTDAKYTTSYEEST